MSAPTALIPIVWQIQFGQNWIALDQPVSDKMEQAFGSTAINADITAALISKTPSKMTFDVEKMTLSDMPVRRSVALSKAARRMSFEFWDDDCWVEFDDYAQTLMEAALANNRNKTAIYVLDTRSTSCSMQMGWCR